MDYSIYIYQVAAAGTYLMIENYSENCIIKSKLSEKEIKRIQG